MKNLSNPDLFIYSTIRFWIIQIDFKKVRVNYLWGFFLTSKFIEIKSSYRVMIINKF